jgi:hypothetical protein
MSDKMKSDKNLLSLAKDDQHCSVARELWDNDCCILLNCHRITGASQTPPHASKSRGAHPYYSLAVWGRLLYSGRITGRQGVALLVLADLGPGVLSLWAGLTDSEV